MGKVGEAATFSDMMEKLLSGNSILFVDGVGSVLYAGTESLKQRGVEEATSQSVVRGRVKASPKPCAKIQRSSGAASRIRTFG